ncbi:hypothetical protein F5B22DRAFT_629421 [Xylaria bambusicola]|uniref:uncharacterized protein n=1 Tax=Xylaria bambusicola TaxID=326684 RepID=UPI002007D42E|nr:uncharacterized protein F5B22DRAFT_629421 [Xylaria bambusicola]KAI0503352.1 hypothetical protein F5B22DRAFT_629421 [Xylaria bambusicola]
MASLRYGIRCLRTSAVSAPKQWPSLSSTQPADTAITKRAIATSASRQQDDSALMSALDALDTKNQEVIATYARPMPVSPSYFSRHPQFNDSFVHVQDLARKYARLPMLHPSQVERVAWKTKEQYRIALGEHVKARDYAACLGLAKRLNQIHPELMPEEVKTGLRPFRRDINIFLNRPKPMPVDKFGRSHGVGKRKTSVARAWLVEGTGEVLINGKPMNEAFGRIHDRESALWGLKTTDRQDKYNVWALVDGGGSTGQAEALAMAIAKALVVQEPPLKTPLRRGKTTSVHTEINTRSQTLTLVFSRLYYPRSKKRGKEEGRSSQSKKESYMGQAIERLSSFISVLGISQGTGLSVYVCFGSYPPRCQHSRTRGPINSRASQTASCEMIQMYKIVLMYLLSCLGYSKTIKHFARGVPIPGTVITKPKRPSCVRDRFWLVPVSSNHEAIGRVAQLPSLYRRPRPR